MNARDATWKFDTSVSAEGVTCPESFSEGYEKRAGTVAPGRTSVSFPTNGLSPGLYFVHLVTERGTDVRKVMVR